MNSEEIERTIDFIIQNQAESHIRMDRTERQHQRLIEAQQASRQDIDTLVQVTRNLVDVSRQTIRRVRRPESGD